MKSSKLGGHNLRSGSWAWVGSRAQDWHCPEVHWAWGQLSTGWRWRWHSPHSPPPGVGVGRPQRQPFAQDPSSRNKSLNGKFPWNPRVWATSAWEEEEKQCLLRNDSPGPVLMGPGNPQNAQRALRGKWARDPAAPGAWHSVAGLALNPSLKEQTQIKLQKSLFPRGSQTSEVNRCRQAKKDGRLIGREFLVWNYRRKSKTSRCAIFSSVGTNTTRQTWSSSFSN